MTSKKKRQRGSKTHSSGSMKNRRGAGHKGGRGDSNAGKRGDAVKPSHWREDASKGFTSLQQKYGDDSVLNLSDVNERLDTYKEAGVAYEDDGELYVDLDRLGVDKLLGSGEGREYSIVVGKASGSAVEKVEEHGGRIVEPE